MNLHAILKMKMTLQRLVLVFAVPLFFFSCATQKRLSEKGISELRLLGEFDLPHRMQFQGTMVGGLSSIDYVAADDVYHLICDDRSEHNPARFYTAKIVLGNNGIDTVQLIKVTTFLQQNGKPYPNRSQDSLHVPDPEALRYNSANGTFVWSSEGERIVRKDRIILSDPSLSIISADGRLIDTLPLPSNLHMTAFEKGPRQNGVFEGLAFTPDHKSLFVSVEEPLYEDGPRAGLQDTAGWIRILKYDMNTRLPVAQYAYQIDPVVQEPISRGAFIVNGVPDILAINSHELIVTERSFSTGRLTCNIRLYLAEVDGAQNIANIASLQQTPAVKPLKKRLLLNMDTLGRWVDNVEGATFGPLLPNGRRSLILVTDDNFMPFERTQFFLFEVR